MDLTETLDAEMKRLRRAPGMLIGPKQAEPISESEEKMLWEKGILGSHSPRPELIPWCSWLGYTLLCTVEMSIGALLSAL